VQKTAEALFLHFGIYVQKTASLYFCTPDLCAKNRRSFVFALRIYVQKTASLYFCTPDLYAARKPCDSGQKDSTA